jgi:hypothetical protein
MRVVTSARRAGTALQVGGVLLTVGLSLAAACVGARLLGAAPPGGWPLRTLAASCFLTLLIPFAFVGWAARGDGRTTVGARLLICLAGYLVPLALVIPVLS